MPRPVLSSEEQQAEGDVVTPRRPLRPVVVEQRTAPDVVATPTPSVCAIVVTAGVTPFLKRTLQAVAGQRRLPAELIVINVGGSGSVAGTVTEELAGLPIRIAVRHVGATNFGDAVNQALVVAGTSREWLWLLHDDSAPAPLALNELMRTVSKSPSVGLAGSKQLTWDEPHRLLQVGLRTTLSGRRFNDIHDDELDQGQYDSRADVLAVSLAGALIRRHLWQKLGGTDPGLGHYGDGLELSRRVRLAGHRVVVVPAAMIHHAQAAHRGLRHTTTLAEHEQRRYSARHYQLSVAPWWALAAVFALVTAAPIGLASRWLLSGQPQLAGAELRGGWGPLLHLNAVLRARRRMRKTQSLPRRVLWPMRAHWSDLWRHALETHLADREPEPTRDRNPWWRPGPGWGGLTFVMAVVVLVWQGKLLGAIVAGQEITGGALGLMPAGRWDLWQEAWSGWVHTGLGVAGPMDPLMQVLAALALVPGAAVVASILVLVAPLFAAWSAWAAVGTIVGSPLVRWWVALIWGLTPLLLDAVMAGRVGAVLAQILLPLTVRVIYQAATGTSARRMAAVAGLLLALLWAADPALLPVNLVLLVGVGALARRRWLWFVPAPGLVLFAPVLWAAARAGQPFQALSDPGMLLTAASPSGWQRLLGLPGEPADMTLFAVEGWWWGAGTGALLLLAALLAVWGQRLVVAVGWTLAATGWVWAAVLTNFPVLAQVPVYLGPSLALAQLGLLVAASAAADRWVQQMSRRTWGWRPALGAAAVATALVSPIAGAGVWIFGTPNQLQTNTGQVPAIAQQALGAPQGSRILVLTQPRTGEPFGYHLLRSDGVLLTEQSALRARGVQTSDDAAATEVARVVAALVVGSGKDQSVALGALGVAYVLVPGEGFDDRDRSHLVGNLDATAGLTRITVGVHGTLWRVAPTFADLDRELVTSWARILPADASPTSYVADQVAVQGDGRTVDDQVTAAVEDRVIVLAERAHPGWQATIDGEKLEWVQLGWRQGFVIPAGRQGQLHIEHHDQLVAVTAIALGVVTVASLTLMVRRRRR